MPSDASAAHAPAEYWTTFYRFELYAANSHEAVTIEPGTLLDVVEHGDTDTQVSVFLADYRKIVVPLELLTQKSEEVAIARALADARTVDDDAQSARILRNARAAHPSARLAPLLEGKPPREMACTSRVGLDESSHGSHTLHAFPGGTEMLGLATRDQPDVAAPAVHDWRALAVRYSPLKPGVALTRDLREQMSRAAVAVVIDRYDEGPTGDIGPHVLYPVPPLEPRGAYYLATAEEIVRIPDTDLRLEGRVDLDVDLDGCERRPRRLSGHVQLAGAPEHGGLVLWFPAPVQLTSVRHVDVDGWTLPQKSWKHHEATMTIHVPDTAGRPRAYKLPVQQPDDPKVMATPVRAALLARIGADLELLVVATRGNPMCSLGLHAYILGDVLTHASGTEYECDW